MIDLDKITTVTEDLYRNAVDLFLFVFVCVQRGEFEIGLAYLDTANEQLDHALERLKQEKQP